MLASFLESMKYVGHLLPVAVLRIFLGVLYFQWALEKWGSDFLIKPKAASDLAEILPQLQLSPWYQSLVEQWMIQSWQAFGFVWMSLEFAIGLSYFFGYVVRPMAILATLWSMNFLFLSLGPQSELHRVLMVVHLVLAGLGAGRCLGVDAYFYKRRRGVWW